MGSLKIAYRRLFRKGEHSLTRIISLAAGLAFGILLLSEVFYYYSFDSFYPDANRIYVVYENFKTDKASDKLVAYSQVSGAIAPALKAEVPGVEAATRLNDIGSSVFYTDDKKSYEATFALADENLFDVLPRPTLAGNAKEILKSPMNCMVSDKIAEKMGGNPVGKIIELKEYPGKKLTVSGIFKDLPENTNYKYDILVSMVSTGQFMWDGTNNWLGNDRYYACIKLSQGVDPKSLEPAVRKMQEVHQDIKHLEEVQHGMVLKYSFMPIKKIQVDNVKDMIIILSAIAFAVLFVSVMNYLLLTLSALVNRAKSSAIHKTCGAQAANLQKMIFSETSLLFIISLFGAAIIIIIMKPLAEAQIGHRLASAFNPYVIWPIILLLTALVVLISYLPGRFFARIPVAAAFRDHHQKSSKWKLGFLSLQFAGATFILTVLVIVTLQYNKMRNSDHGYKAKGVYYSSTSGMPGNKITAVLDQLRAMPEAVKVGLGTCVPTEHASGNNFRLPDEEKELFNVADFYWIDENYLSILNIPVIEGSDFSLKSSVPNDFLISKKGAEMLTMYCNWKDGVLGKQINLTEHGVYTIRGIFPDFVINSIANPDNRPAVFSYLSDQNFEDLIVKHPSFSCYVMVRVNEGLQKGIRDKIAAVMNSALPHQDAVVNSLEDDQTNRYSAERGFRNAMLAGNIVILLIMLIGLLGYIVTEVTRRRKEVAIRKINGAKLSDILKIFILDLEYIAIPAVLIGLAGAWLTAGKWMQNFASKIRLNWDIFLLCSLFILVMIAVVSAVNYLIVANKNPVEALRYE
jgi:putative ABC transport system permease protein